jgi:hypothetical protein
MLNPDERPATKMTTYEFYDCRRLRLNSLIALLVIAREMSIAMLPWAQGVGRSNRPAPTKTSIKWAFVAGFRHTPQRYYQHFVLISFSTNICGSSEENVLASFAVRSRIAGFGYHIIHREEHHYG